MKHSPANCRWDTVALTLSVVAAPLLALLVSPVLGLVILAFVLLGTVAALLAVRAQAAPRAQRWLALLMAGNVLLAMGCLCAAIWLALQT